MTRSIGEEVGRCRPRLHGGEPAVHYGGDVVTPDLQREPTGAQPIEERLGELFEHHLHMDLDDFESVRSGLLGKSSRPTPRADARSTPTVASSAVR